MYPGGMTCGTGQAVLPAHAELDFQRDAVRIKNASNPNAICELGSRRLAGAWGDLSSG